MTSLSLSRTRSRESVQRKQLSSPSKSIVCGLEMERKNGAETKNDDWKVICEAEHTNVWGQNEVCWWKLFVLQTKWLFKFPNWKYHRVFCDSFFKVQNMIQWKTVHFHIEDRCVKYRTLFSQIFGSCRLWRNNTLISFIDVAILGLWDFAILGPDRF